MSVTNDADPSLHASHLASRLRFRHLQLLMEAERGGSLRAAAQALHLTQPALSKALGEIEASFGCRLFTRTARGLVPTEQGRAVVRGARRLLADLGHLQREVALADGAVILRIGAPPFVAHGHLPAALARLTRERLGVSVELTEERVPWLLRSLAAGQLDALVSSYPAQMPADLGVPLRVERLFDARFQVIAPASWKSRRGRVEDWAELSRLPCVIPDGEAMIRRVVEESFARAGLALPPPVVVSTSPVTNVQLVAAGVGWGVVPEQTARQAHAAGQVRVLRLSAQLPPGTVALIHVAHADEARMALIRDALAPLRRAAE